MAMQQLSYQEARSRMKPGDVLAFGGKGHLSEIIKLATLCTVSHVGVILQTKVVDDDTNRFFNQIIESTSMHGFSGVSISRVSDRLNDYHGDIWWLPIRQKLWDTKFDQKIFYDFLFNQAKEKKAYDMTQAMKSAIDALDKLPLGMHGPSYNKEDFSRFFCSELVAAGLEQAGTVPAINASEVTPIDLCRWNIYEDDYYLIQGDPEKRISRYNTLEPALWNV